MAGGMNYFLNCVTNGTLRAAYRIRQNARLGSASEITCYGNVIQPRLAKALVGPAHDNDVALVLQYPTMHYLANQLHIARIEVDAGSGVLGIARDLELLRRGDCDNPNLAALKNIKVEQGLAKQFCDSNDAVEAMSATRISFRVRSLVKSLPLAILLGTIHHKLTSATIFIAVGFGILNSLPSLASQRFVYAATPIRYWLEDMFQSLRSDKE
jgi:hypothetical protein